MIALKGATVASGGAQTRQDVMSSHQERCSIQMSRWVSTSKRVERRSLLAVLTAQF